MTTTPASADDAARTDRPRTSSSSGRIHFWQGASLWLGRSEGRTQWHDHHAHQLALALDGDFRFRTEADGPWQVYRGALVPSHRTHQFEVDGGRLAHFFIEPESRAGRALISRCGGVGGVLALPQAEAEAARLLLVDALARPLDSGQTVAVAVRALAALCGAGAEAVAEPAAELDPRLARALAHVREHIRQPLTLAAVAAVAHLSESRFRHLFVAETGSSFRAYLLWLRINVAIEAAMAGASWTEAAHEAGFADSAHLTRTHRRMFGIEPSSVRQT